MDLIDGGSCGNTIEDKVSYAIKETDDETTLIIAGKGMMKDFSFDGSIWKGKTFSSVIIEDGVTTIGNWSFFGITTIETVYLKNPDLITKYGGGCFHQCSNLKSFIIYQNDSENESQRELINTAYIGSSLIEIGGSALIGCNIEKYELSANNTFYHLNDDGILYSKKEVDDNKYSILVSCPEKKVSTFKIEWLKGVSEIGAGAFRQCGNISYKDPEGSTTFDDTIANIKIIGKQAFQKSGLELNQFTLRNDTNYGTYLFQDVKIKKVVIQEGITELKSGTFNNNEIESLKLPNTLKIIGDGALAGLVLNEELIIPEGVTKIGTTALSNGTFTAISLPSTLTEVGNYVFQGSTINSINIPDNLKNLNSMFMGTIFTGTITVPNTVEDIGSYFMGSSYEGLSNNSSKYGVGIINCQTTIGRQFWNSSLSIVVLNESTKSGNNDFYYWSGTAYLSNNITPYDSNNEIKTTFAYMNGGKILNADGFTDNTLCTPVKEGYIFAGWYTDKNFSEESKLTDNTYTPGIKQFFYARWAEIDINKAEIKLSDLKYNGEEQTENVTITYTDSEKNTSTLTEGTDYILSGNKGTSAKDYTLTITGIKKYCGTVEKTFTISKADFNMDGIELNDSSKEYTGKLQRIEISGELPKGATNNDVLSVEYSGGGTDVGGPYTVTATFKVSGGNYNIPEAMTATLTITPKMITANGVTAAEKTYDGTNTISLSEATLNGVIDGDPISVIPSASLSDVNVGNYDLNISYELKGDKAGNYLLDTDNSQKTVSVAVNKATPVAGDFVISGDQLVYDGTEKTATINIRTGIDGMGTFTETYDGASSMTNAKTYIVKVSTTGGTNYNNVTDLEIGSVTVAKADTAISSNPTSIIIENEGDVATFTIGLTSNGTGLASSDIDVMKGDTKIGTLTTDNNGSATFTYDPETGTLQKGSIHILSFVYAGDSNHTGSSCNVTLLILASSITVEGNSADVNIQKDEPIRINMNNGSSVTITITDTHATSTRVPVAVSVVSAQTQIPGMIETYDITLNTDKSFTAMITLPTSIPNGSTPIVTSYNDDGTIYRNERVVSWTSSSVTFETDHNTLFAVGSYVPTTPGTDSDDSYQQWLQQYYQQLAEQQKQQQALKEQQEQRKVVSVAIAGIAVVILSIAALMVTRRK